MLRRALWLAHMLRNEWRSPDELHAAQDRRLRALVRRAALEVPFYRDAFAVHGIDAAAFRGLADLAALPIVSKSQLRAAGAQTLAQRRPDDPGVSIATGGSTGSPFTFRIDREHDQWRKAQYLRPYLSAGRRLTDRVLRLNSIPRPSRPWFARLGLLDETAIACGADPAAVVAAWRRLRPDILQGYPSALRLLAHHCLQSGEPLSPAPRRVFSDSELLTPDTRHLVERALGVAPIDVFGTFETDNIAYQCGQGGGYHIAEDCVVLEVVRDGRPVPDGEDGELVATVLGNHRSPLIRYALGDLGRRARESCRCGRSFPLLEVVSGRADDRIVLAGGQLRPALHLIGPLDAFAAVLLRFQLRQRDVRHFELSLVPAPGFSNADRAAIEACVRARIDGASLVVRIVDRVALTGAGKLRCFVSDLQAAAHA